MGSVRRLGWAGLVLLLAGGAAADPGQTGPSVRPARIPASAFAAAPPLTSLNLSPKGDRVLGLLTQGAVDKVAVLDLVGKQSVRVPLPDKWRHDEYWWAGDHRVLIRVGRTMPFDLDEAYFTRLLVIDLATEKIRMLGDGDLGPLGGDVLYIDRSGDWALVAMQRTAYDYPSVYRFDLATGKRTLVTPSVPSVWDWYADSAGVVRYGKGQSFSSWFMLYRRGADDRFERIPGERLERGEIVNIRMNPGSDEGFVLSNERTGRFALHRFNFATQTLGAVLYQNDANDIDDFSLDPTGTAVQVLTFVDDQRRTVWFEPLLKSYQRKVEQANPGKQVQFIDADRDWTRFLVWIGADDDPGAVHVYEPDQGLLRALIRENSALERQPLARTHYVRYKARDGLEIPAYLTLPVGRPAKGLPLIVMPHGGPYDVRDELEFNPEVQFLANRGYAVLQPNYRGSGGYGRNFYRAGEGQWGRAMQDDLDDGMDWLARDGVVDPKRVCVYGASYGGYAALWAATRNPERYRCGISLAGVSDVKRQLKYQVGNISNRYRRDWKATVMGSEDFDLATISPLQQIGRLKVPVMVGHGSEDERVPPKQSSLYAAALKKAGKTYEYYTYEGEGHGLVEPVHEQDWLERLDAFLAKYNPAD